MAILATASSAPAQAAADQPVPSADTLLVAAGGARYVLTASVDRLADALDPQSRAVMLTALRTGGRTDRDPLWSLLATGALQFRHETAAGGTSVWFNPLFDAGIAVRWRHDTKGWTIAAAAPILGETLRGEAEPVGRLAASPTWLTSTPSLGPSLKGAQAASWSHIAAADWNPAIDAPETVRAARVHVAQARVARGLLALRGMATDTRYRPALRSIRLGLSGSAGGAAVPRPILDDLAALGPRVITTMRPVAAFRRHDGWSVALQSPDAPAITLLAHFVEPLAPGNASTPAAILSKWDIVHFAAPAASTGSIRP